MTTNRPKMMPVMGVPFRIQQAKKLAGGKEDGQCWGSLRKIVVRSDTSEMEFESILLHEIIHAVLYVSGQSQMFTNEQEEGLVLALEHGLLPLYQRRIKKSELSEDKA